MSKPLMATAPMESVGLDWAGVYLFAEKAVKLIQDHGNEFLDMIDAGFKAFKAITGRDYAAIFTELNRVNVDLQALIAAIQAEFAIN